MKRILSISLLALFAVTFTLSACADTITYHNNFDIGKVSSGWARWDSAGTLSPYYSNLRYEKYGSGANLRLEDPNKKQINLAQGSGDKCSIQIDASTFVSGATCFDLTAGDLVYEAYYGCDWNSSAAGNFHSGIAINSYNNDCPTRLIYHPGYNNGAFRIEGSWVSCSNQDIGFTPQISSSSCDTMMKLTIHLDEEAGNYVFTTEFGQVSTGKGYTYSYTTTVPISTIDAAGGIKSIGPYGFNASNTLVSNLSLQAPFSAEAFQKAKSYSDAWEYVVSNDKPLHWYKFNDATTNVIKDYGSSPVNGTANNIDMSATSELRTVADCSGNSSYVTTNIAELAGPWTAEFVLNTTTLGDCQALLNSSTHSLRLIQWHNAGVPGFTTYGVKDYIFTDVDGTPFSTEIPTNEWMHIAFVNDGESMLFYLDGELVGKNTEALIPLPLSDLLGSGEPFDGMVDEITIYGYALTADQILAHANPQMPIPEPSTWALLILGSAGLMWLKRSEKNKLRTI